MTWNYTLDYDDRVLKYLKAHRLVMVDDLTEFHLHVLSWLDDNLQDGKDYKWSNTRPAWSKHLYFDKEEDLLAFKIACGL